MCGCVREFACVCDWQVESLFAWFYVKWLLLWMPFTEVEAMIDFHKIEELNHFGVLQEIAQQKYFPHFSSFLFFVCFVSKLYM